MKIRVELLDYSSLDWRWILFVDGEDKLWSDEFYGLKEHPIPHLKDIILHNYTFGNL